MTTVIHGQLDMVGKFCSNDPIFDIFISLWASIVFLNIPNFTDLIDLLLLYKKEIVSILFSYNDGWI